MLPPGAEEGPGEAPAIDVWYGAEGEVEDGSQGSFTGGLLVRQNFDGVTAASEEDKFKDENCDYVYLWTQGEWVDVKISVMNKVLKINYKGHEVINHDLPPAPNQSSRSARAPHSRPLSPWPPGHCPPLQ